MNAETRKTLEVLRIDWIPKRKYLELTGETDDAVKKRMREDGAWQRGVHWNKPDGGGVWISLRAVNRWAKGQLGP